MFFGSIIFVLWLLSVGIHVFVILFVFARGDVVEPLFVVEIPLHGFLYSFLKLQAWLPAEFCLELARVDGVTGHTLH